MSKFPVPNNFFYCPPLGDDEKENLIRVGESSLIDLVRSSKLQDGMIRWEMDSDENGIQIFYGEDPNGPAEVTLLASSTEVLATFDEVAALFRVETAEQYLEYTKLFAKDLLDAAHLYSISSPTEDRPRHYTGVRWIVVGSPYPLVANRDYCYLECQDDFEMNGKRGWGRSLTSINLPCCPDFFGTLGTIRATFIRSGFVVLEAKRPGYLKIIHALQTDFKGNIPKWVVKIGMKRRARTIGDVDTYLRERRLSSSPFLREHQLVPKALRSKCYLCQSKFGALSLKARCRKCGEVVCGKCNKYWEVDTPRGRKAIRVCSACSITGGRDITLSEYGAGVTASEMSDERSESSHQETLNPTDMASVSSYDHRPHNYPVSNGFNQQHHSSPAFRREETSSNGSNPPSIRRQPQQPAPRGTAGAPIIYGSSGQPTEITRPPNGSKASQPKEDANKQDDDDFAPRESEAESDSMSAYSEYSLYQVGRAQPFKPKLGEIKEINPYENGFRRGQVPPPRYGQYEDRSDNGNNLRGSPVQPRGVYGDRRHVVREQSQLPQVARDMLRKPVHDMVPLNSSEEPLDPNGPARDPPSPQVNHDSYPPKRPSDSQETAKPSKGQSENVQGVPPRRKEISLDSPLSSLDSKRSEEPRNQPRQSQETTVDSKESHVEHQNTPPPSSQDFPRSSHDIPYGQKDVHRGSPRDLQLDPQDSLRESNELPLEQSQDRGLQGVSREIQGSPFKSRNFPRESLNFPHDLRGLPVDPHELLVDPRGLPVDPRELPHVPRGFPVDPRELPRVPRGFPVDPRELPREHRGLPVDPRGLSRDPRDLPVDPRELPRDPRGFPIDPRRVPRDPRGFPVDPRELSRDPRGRAIDFEDLPSDPCEISRGPFEEARRPVDPQGFPPDPRDLPQDFSNNPQHLVRGPHEVSMDPRFFRDPRQPPRGPSELPRDTRELARDPRQLPHDPREVNHNIREQPRDPREQASDPRRQPLDPREAPREIREPQWNSRDVPHRDLRGLPLESRGYPMDFRNQPHDSRSYPIDPRGAPREYGIDPRDIPVDFRAYPREYPAGRNPREYQMDPRWNPHGYPADPRRGHDRRVIPNNDPRFPRDPRNLPSDGGKFPLDQPVDPRQIDNRPQDDEFPSRNLRPEYDGRDYPYTREAGWNQPRDYYGRDPRDYPRDILYDRRDYPRDHYPRDEPAYNPNVRAGRRGSREDTRESIDGGSVKAESIQDEVAKVIQALKGEQTPDPKQLLALYKQLQQMNLEGAN
ncbi:hypothetical protein AeNC1_001774 [Aphanomyces euteiches]|nr:hypothetical protein AeNC1_001774 [Aphanomyces euteiches]